MDPMLKSLFEDLDLSEDEATMNAALNFPGKTLSELEDEYVEKKKFEVLKWANAWTIEHSESGAVKVKASMIGSFLFEQLTKYPQVPIQFILDKYAKKRWFKRVFMDFNIPRQSISMHSTNVANQTVYYPYAGSTTQEMLWNVDVTLLFSVEQYAEVQSILASRMNGTNNHNYCNPSRGWLSYALHC